MCTATGKASLGKNCSCSSVMFTVTCAEALKMGSNARPKMGNENFIRTRNTLNRRPRMATAKLPPSASMPFSASDGEKVAKPDEVSAGE